MRDKLIDIILTAQGYLQLEEAVVSSGHWSISILVELEHMRNNAEKIADALLAAGVVQQWVSAEDALPEEGKMCCVVTEQGVKYAAYYGEYGWEASERGYSFHLSDVEWWCEFPAPPMGNNLCAIKS
jgi:hypothetical protein